MICTYCGNEHDDKYCPFCGMPQTEPQPNAPSTTTAEENWGVHADVATPEPEPSSSCPGCGAPVHGEKFCSSCGTPLQGSTPPQDQATTNSWQHADTTGGSAPQPQPSIDPTLHPMTANYLWVLHNQPDRLVKKMSGLIKFLIILGVLLHLGSSVFAFGLSMYNANRTFNELSDPSYYNDYYDYDWFDENWDEWEIYDEEDGSYSDTMPDYFENTEALPMVPDGVMDEGDSLYPNGISIAEYRQLALGMTYTEVSSLIGGDGVFTSDEVSDSYFEAMWIGEYTESAFVFMQFENQQLTAVAQQNLF